MPNIGGPYHGQPPPRPGLTVRPLGGAGAGAGAVSGAGVGAGAPPEASADWGPMAGRAGPIPGASEGWGMQQMPGMAGPGAELAGEGEEGEGDEPMEGSSHKMTR